MPFKSTSRRLLFVAVAVGLFASMPMSGQTARKVTQLADGVYEIEHEDALDGFASGNTTVIMGGAYMDAFPALTIIAHAETKKDMDMFGPGSESREEKGAASLQHMLDAGKTGGGRTLTAEEKKMR